MGDSNRRSLRRLVSTPRTLRAGQWEKERVFHEYTFAVGSFS